MVRWDLFCFVTWGTSQSATLYSILRHILTSVIQSSNSLEVIYQVEWKSKCCWHYLYVLSRVHRCPFYSEKVYFGKTKVNVISAAWPLSFTICGSWTGERWWGILSNLDTSADSKTMESRFLCGYMISRAWAFTSRISAHLLLAPQITCRLSQNRQEGQRASSHACHSQQCPIWSLELPVWFGPGWESEKKQHTHTQWLKREAGS